MKDCKMEKGKITIEFTSECLICDHETPECGDENVITLKIHADEHGDPSISPDKLLVLLVRLVSAGIIISTGSEGNTMREALVKTCHIGGFIADEIEKFKDGYYNVKVNLPPPRSTIEA